MNAVINHQVRLAARPVGLPRRSDWSFTGEALRPVADGEFLARLSHVSLDPAMRGWMSAAKSYMEPVAVGEVMRAWAVGQVVETKHPDFRIGDPVVGRLGVQEYAYVQGAGGVRKVDTGLAPPAAHLGPLGMTGMTAYFGLLDVGRPQPGETVVVSGAAGSVGSMVGQIARIKGCRTVGIAGGAGKCRHVVQTLGFDHCIDYKSEDVATALARLCPQGVDVYFDNVGGDILDAVLLHLARKARVVICGAISQYNATGPVKGPSNYFSLLVHRASMTGMLGGDFADRYHEAIPEMAGWMAQGILKQPEDVFEGLENFPDVFLKLFSG